MLQPKSHQTSYTFHRSTCSRPIPPTQRQIRKSTIILRLITQLPKACSLLPMEVIAQLLVAIRAQGPRRRDTIEITRSQTLASRTRRSNQCTRLKKLQRQIISRTLTSNWEVRQLKLNNKWQKNSHRIAQDGAENSISPLKTQRDPRLPHQCKCHPPPNYHQWQSTTCHT